MSGTASATSDFTPGTKLFAPQARLVKQNGEPLQVGGRSINEDIVSLTVTQPCNGVGQTEIVLNNQRFDAYHLQTPIWRYNKLDPAGIAFGSRLRVDLRYGSDPWTPMMLVRVTELTLGFPTASGGTMTVKGEDLLSVLKTRPTASKTHSGLHEIDIVEQTLTDCGCGLSLAPLIPRQMFGAPLGTLTHEKTKTNLQIIQELAERMDHEVYVEFDNPGQPLPRDPANPNTPVEVIPTMYFRPARSATLGEPVTLAWNVDIVEFKPTIKVMETLTAVEAAGNVPGGRGSINVTVPASPDAASQAIDDLHAAPGGPTPLSAAALRLRAVDTEMASRTSMARGQVEQNVGSIQATNLDQQRAEMQAKAAFRKSQREFLTAEVTVIGVAGLRPGIHVNLSRFHAPFDGIYYVTQAVHSLSSSGYTTKLSLRRPGMLDPSGYPGA